MDKIVVSIETRPAFWEGYAGIPVETRNLIKILASNNSFATKCFLNPNLVYFYDIYQNKLDDKDNLRRLIINIENYEKNKIYNFLLRKLNLFFLFLFFYSKKIYKYKFEDFANYFWERIFSKSIVSKYFKELTSLEFFYYPFGYSFMSEINVLYKGNYYFKINIPASIFITQTPYPAKIQKPTIHIVRYHDAIPLTHPNLISNSKFHYKSHYYNLKLNIKNDAWFCCVSNSTKNELIKLFPEVKERSSVIYNCISDEYFIDKQNTQSLVNDIIRSNIAEENIKDNNKKQIGPNFFSNKEKNNFYQKILSDKQNYILAVSTIEPRKNYKRLISAWNKVRRNGNEKLKLIIVGGFGWDFLEFIKQTKTFIERGELLILNGISNFDLGILYNNAKATICPSVIEGFDFSGVEAMASGSVIVASDISVHREIYKDGPVSYFDPYSISDLAKKINEAININDDLKKEFISRGKEIAKLYTEKNIAPEWDILIKKLKNSQ